MARKSASFGQLLAYIEAPTRKGPAFVHNLISGREDVSGIYREFLDNSRYLRRRKNGNVLYHEVLSFSEADRERLNFEAVEDLVRRYVAERAPHCLVYARAHWDRPNPHVHLVISANEVASARRIRLSTARFAGIKRSLEAYQRERYPWLSHSIAQKESMPGRSTRRPSGRAESELRRRESQGPATSSVQKELVREACEEQLREARSVESLLMRLRVLGLEVYFRGRHAGVQDHSSGKRYRFTTIGLAGLLEEKLVEWEAVEARERLLQEADAGRLRRRWSGFGFRSALASILEEEAPPAVGSRSDLLGRARRLRRADRSGRGGSRR